MASNTTAVAPCTPQTVAFGPLLRSTMMASPIGMVLAASSNQPRTWGILAASRMTAISPEAMSRTPLTDR